MTNDLPDWASTVYQPDVPIAGSPVSYINGFTTKTLAIPNGVHILNIVLPGFPNISLITVTGATSGTQYLAETPNENIYQKQYFALIPQLVDTSVTVDITAGATGTAYFSGILAPIAVASLPQNPAPWQAPNRPPVAFTFANPGQNLTATLISAPINAMSIWLHGMTWIWSAGAAALHGNFQDSGGNRACYDIATAGGIPRFMDFGGAKLAGGDAFQYFQDGSAASGTGQCYGAVSYSVF